MQTQQKPIFKVGDVVRCVNIGLDLGWSWVITQPTLTIDKKYICLQYSNIVRGMIKIINDDGLDKWYRCELFNIVGGI